MNLPGMLLDGLNPVENRRNSRCGETNLHLQTAACWHHAGRLIIICVDVFRFSIEHLYYIACVGPASNSYE